MGVRDYPMIVDPPKTGLTTVLKGSVSSLQTMAQRHQKDATHILRSRDHTLKKMSGTQHVIYTCGQMVSSFNNLRKSGRKQACVGIQTVIR